jgi:ribonuclease HIII
VSGPRVVKLSPEVGDRLRSRLEALDYTFTHVAHARWAARGEGAVVTYYESGKLVVAGKGADAFVDGRLGWEEDERPADETVRVTSRVIGTDEAGKGDYFGPLVTAAVLVGPEQVDSLVKAGVRDSKDLSDAAARAIAARVRRLAPHAVVAIGPPRYNELRKSNPNLNRLLAWTHARAAAEILETTEADEALADQFGAKGLLESAFAKQGVAIPLRQRPRAESHPAVAAASILARAVFLDRLERLGREVGRSLPKGAGPPVDLAARELVAEQGREVLGRVAKLHFKTTEKVLGSLF